MANFNDVVQYRSWDELDAKHRQETRKLEGELRALLKKAKKSEKKEAEAKAVQLEYDLKAKHRDEEALLEEYLEKHGDGENEVGMNDNDNEVIAEKEHEEKEQKRKEDEAAQARIAKAAKKKNKKAAKEAELQRVKDEIAENAGPALRDMELDAINALLIPIKSRVKEIEPDGNCMYRSISEQAMRQDPSLDYIKLRKIAADYMRTHAEDFAPFIEEGIDFTNYCDRVENIQGKVEWGGQIEIRALSSALRREIQIYDSTAPVLVMDNDGDVDKSLDSIRITYHRHFYALGEHYNSVEALPSTSEETATSA